MKPSAKIARMQSGRRQTASLEPCITLAVCSSSARRFSLALYCTLHSLIGMFSGLAALFQDFRPCSTNECRPELPCKARGKGDPTSLAPKATGFPLSKPSSCY